MTGTGWLAGCATYEQGTRTRLERKIRAEKRKGESEKNIRLYVHTLKAAQELLAVHSAAQADGSYDASFCFCAFQPIQYLGSSSTDVAVPFVDPTPASTE